MDVFIFFLTHAVSVIISFVLILWISQFLVNRTEEWWKHRKREHKTRKVLKQLTENLHTEFDAEFTNSYRKGYERGYSDKEKDLPYETELQRI